MAAALVSKGDELFREGSYLKAAGQWTRAIKADPEVAQDALLQCNLCYALLKAHKFSQAIDAADRAIELGKEAGSDSKSASQQTGKAHYRRGLCLIALERWDEAVQEMLVAQALLGKQNQEVQSMLVNSKWQCRKMHEANGTEVPKSCADAVDPNASAKEGKENAKPKTAKQEKAAAKARMAAKLAAEKAERQQHHAKKVKQTLIALQEAQKELLTKQMIDEQAEVKEADTLAPELLETLASDEMYNSTAQNIKTGDDLEYSSERIQRFAQLELQNLLDPAKADQYKTPLAIVLPGVANDYGDEGQGVNLLGAFETAKQHSNTAKWVQSYAVETKSHAMLIVCPKADLIYPNKLKGWKCAVKGGHYVQLETRQPEDRRMWFVAEANATELELGENANLLEDPKDKKKKKR